MNSEKNNKNDSLWGNLPVEGKVWIHDKLHSNNPFSPAAQILQGEYLEKGFNRAFKEYGLPYRVDVRFFNEYYYINIPPFQKHIIDDEILESHIEIYNSCVKNYQTSWNDNFLPKMNEHNRAFNNYSIGNDIELLIKEFADFIERAEDLWFIHGLNFLPMFIAPSQFIKKCKASGIEDTSLIFDSLISLNNQTTDMGRELLRIVKAIQDSSELLDIFPLHNDQDVLKKLSEINNGQEIIFMINEFMQKFGARNDFCLEVSQPLWRETPHKIISLIRLQLRQDANFFDNKQRELKYRKTRAYETIKNHVNDTNPEWANEFEVWYKAACLAISAQEDHNYYIEQRIIEQSRRFYLRFNEILLDTSNKENKADIFMLKPQELMDFANGKLPEPDKLISYRKQQYEQALLLKVPEILGAINFQEIKSTPLNESIADFFGEKLPQENVKQTLKGHGIGKKTISGYARVLSSLEEAETLQPGEILITVSPSAAWTALFSIAGALITEQGGRLCHTAIVAREYDLPAIVGAPNAATFIQTGDWVTLDPIEGIINYRSKR